MNELTQKSYAKINLCLHVLKRLPNGYHLISSLMQRVALHDEVMLRIAHSGIKVETNWAELNEELEQNTAKKAAQLFFLHTDIRAGIEIFIHKNIPHQAGLGGSSSNAAAVIDALDKMFETKLSYVDKCALALQVGADVPFFIQGSGTAKVEGIGEKITMLPAIPPKDILIVKPPFGVSTKEAYEELQPALFDETDCTQALYAAYLQSDYKTIDQCTMNTFEINTKHREQILQIKKEYKESNAITSLMSGSGSAVFAVFSSREMCYNAYQKMRLRNEEIFITTFC